MARGWFGNSEGHRKAAEKGHRGVMRRNSDSGTHFNTAREEKYYKRRDKVVGKGVYGPMSIHESRSYGAKKAAKTRKAKARKANPAPKKKR